MLTVELKSNGYIVSGHAGYAEHGKDIVCSAVSVLAQTIALEMQEYTSVNYQKSSGYVFVWVEHKGIESRILLSAFERGVREIERAFPEYVKIIS